MTILHTDQRGTDEKSITLHDVERAWADSVGATDMFERKQSPANRQRMLELCDYAERLQELYNHQWEDHQAYLAQKRKWVVLVDNGHERTIDSDFCPHLNTMWQKTEDECFLQCLDCGFVERDDGSWGPEELPEDNRDYPDMFEVPNEQ